MESALVVTIGLFVLLGGTVAVLSRQGSLPWSRPALRTPGGASVAERELESAHGWDPASEGMIEATLTGPSPVERTPFVDGRPTRLPGERSERRDPVRLDALPDSAEHLAARLDQIEERLAEIARAVDRQAGEIGQELRRARSEQALRTEADEARQNAALERLRADVLAALSISAVEGTARPSVRRPEVSAELYARLARLEAALAAVTNPILLPGETYAPPAELLPEALVWENWNEVGERAFSLADAYSAQRLHLSEETRGDVDLFVTTLRTLLTRSVYPNLQLEPDADQQAALRAALEEIAAALPKVRLKLEWEYRQGRS